MIKSIIIVIILLTSLKPVYSQICTNNPAVQCFAGDFCCEVDIPSSESYCCNSALEQCGSSIGCVPINDTICPNNFQVACSPGTYCCQYQDKPFYTTNMECCLENTQGCGYYGCYNYSDIVPEYTTGTLCATDTIVEFRCPPTESCCLSSLADPQLYECCASSEVCAVGIGCVIDSSDTCINDPLVTCGLGQVCCEVDESFPVSYCCNIDTEQCSTAIGCVPLNHTVCPTDLLLDCTEDQSCCEYGLSLNDCCNKLTEQCDSQFGCIPVSSSPSPSITPSINPSPNPSITPSINPSTTSSPVPSITSSPIPSPVPSQSGLIIETADKIIYNQDLIITGRLNVSKLIVVIGDLTLTEMGTINIDHGLKISVNGSVTLAGEIIINVNERPDGTETIVIEAENIEYQEYVFTINEKYDKKECEILNHEKRENAGSLSVVFDIDSTNCQSKKKGTSLVPIILSTVIPVICCCCILFVITAIIILLVLYRKNLMWKLFNYEADEDKALRKEMKRRNNKERKLAKNCSVDITPRSSSVGQTV